MSLNIDIIGKKYQPTRVYHIGVEKIVEFAKVTGVTNPVFLDTSVSGSSEETTMPVTSTFSVVVQQLALEQLIADPDADLDFTRIVHGSQEFVYHKQIVAGMKVYGVLTVSDVRILGANSLLSTVTDIFDLDDNLLVTAKSILVIRGEEG